MNILDTVDCDILNLNARSFSIKLHSTRQRTKKKSFNGVIAQGVPRLSTEDALELLP